MDRNVNVIVVVVVAFFDDVDFTDKGRPELEKNALLVGATSVL